MPIHLPKPDDRAGESQTGIAKQPGHADRPPSTVVDRRPVAAEGFALRQLADNSRPVADGQALQTMANNSPRVREAPAFQRMVNSSARMNPQPQNAAAIPVQLHANGVAQLVAQGTYITTGKANLRNEANIENVIAAVPARERVTVGEHAKTRKWRKLLRSKDHTLVSWKGRTGWLKDEVLGSPATAPETAAPRSSVMPPSEAASESRSLPASRGMPIGTYGGKSLTSISIDDLNVDREYDRQRELESGKRPEFEPGEAEKDFVPLGLDRDKQENAGVPEDYLIQIGAGILLSSAGAPLEVDNQAFVLSTDGKLYGGPHKGVNGLLRAPMIQHSTANVGIAAWAGMLSTTAGKVRKINNDSGTYKFSNAANLEILKFFYRNNIITEAELRRGDITIAYVIDPRLKGKEALLDRGESRKYAAVTGLYEQDSMEDMDGHDADERKDDGSDMSFRPFAQIVPGAQSR